MSSDNQYTALGRAIVGFQTNGTNIDRGAEIAGNSLGIQASCDAGPGMIGESRDSRGVIRHSRFSTGVEGSCLNPDGDRWHRRSR